MGGRVATARLAPGVGQLPALGYLGRNASVVLLLRVIVAVARDRLA